MINLFRQLDKNIFAENKSRRNPAFSMVFVTKQAFTSCFRRAVLKPVFSQRAIQRFAVPVLFGKTQRV